MNHLDLKNRWKIFTLIILGWMNSAVRVLINKINKSLFYIEAQVVIKVQMWWHVFIVKLHKNLSIKP